MKDSEITIKLINKIGKESCHRGHKIGDTFNYADDRGKLCPMAMHVAFPYIDIIKYGGSPPKASNGEVCFCCPDSDVINVFKIERSIKNDKKDN